MSPSAVRKRALTGTFRIPKPLAERLSRCYRSHLIAGSLCRP